MEFSNRKNSLANIITGGLFILLYCILSFHSRLASDDFFYLGLENHFGAWDGMLYQYENWSGRWTAHFVACFLLRFSEYKLFLPFIHLITLAGLFFPIRKLISNIFRQPATGLTSLTLAFICTFFFSSFNIGESWFWYIIIITYLWSLIAFLFTIRSVFSKNNIFNWFTIFISALFIGGASESFALIFLFTLCLMLFYSKKIIRNKIYNSRLIFALILILISFSYSYFAPGTAIRQSVLPHVSIMEKAIIYFKSIAKYFIYFLPNKIFYLVIFSVPWFYFGRNLAIEVNVLRTIKKITLIFISFLLIVYIPTVYIMSNAGPDRALLIVSFITVIYISVLFALTGFYFKKKPVLFLLPVYFAASGILFYYLIDQYSSTKDFANAYDIRMELLKNAKNENRTEEIEVERLPPQGMLYWEELSVDSTYFTNKHLKSGMDLPFSVRAK